MNNISTTIYVPKKIKVGFNERNDTYTGKLAYIIYYDEKGKLRKETSWNSWRDKSLDPEEYDNEPTSGFVLNKKVGDYSGDWGAHRQAYCRIYDPRGFEFEITINNLLFILEHCTCCPGKGLEGDFVYGWDGKDLVLLPTNSPDYIEIEKYSKRINNRKIFTGKDLIIGATYLTKDNEEWIYMGRFDKWNCHIATYHEGSYYYRYNGWSDNVDDTWIKDSYANQAYKNENKGKHYWFINLNSEWKFDRIKIFKSLSSKIIDVINEKCVQNYADLYAELEKESDFSPIDYGKDEVHEMKYKSFDERVKHINEWPHYINLYSSTYHGFVKLCYDEYYNGYYNRKADSDKKWYIKYDSKHSRYLNSTEYKVYETLQEAFEDIRPLQRKRYLKNGILYKTDW